MVAKEDKQCNKRIFTEWSWTLLGLYFQVYCCFFYGNAFADYQTILKKAKQGNAESQYSLGTLYELGEGVAEDDKEA